MTNEDARPSSPLYGRMLKSDTLKKHREWEKHISECLLYAYINTASWHPIYNTTRVQLNAYTFHLLDFASAWHSLADFYLQNWFPRALTVIDWTRTHTHIMDLRSARPPHLTNCRGVRNRAKLIAVIRLLCRRSPREDYICRGQLINDYCFNPAVSFNISIHIEKFRTLYLTLFQFFGKNYFFIYFFSIFVGEPIWCITKSQIITFSLI